MNSVIFQTRTYPTHGEKCFESQTSDLNVQEMMSTSGTI